MATTANNNNNNTLNNQKGKKGIFKKVYDNSFINHNLFFFLRYKKSTINTKWKNRKILKDKFDKFWKQKYIIKKIVLLFKYTRFQQILISVKIWINFYEKNILFISLLFIFI